MKENFIIIIESLHLADAGMQHNVSHILCAVDSQSSSWFFAQTPICYDFCLIHHIWYKNNASGFFSPPSGTIITVVMKCTCRSQWLRSLRRRSAAARLVRLWVRIPPGAWMFVCCECCVLSGRGLCDELITRPEESYRLWCVIVCDLETSRMRRP